MNVWLWLSNILNCDPFRYRNVYLCLETVSTFCVKSTKDEFEENQTNALKLERPTSTTYYVSKTTV